MKLLISVILVGSLFISAAYGLDEEAKDRLISLYNYTRNCYIHLENLIDDFKESKIDSTRAEEKLEEWKDEYSKEMDAAPAAARKLREQMLGIYDTAKELVHDYRPQNLKTKKVLEELEKAKSALFDEMTAIKYLVQ